MCCILRTVLLIACVASDVAFSESTAELGKRLFFDSRLSGDGSRSCADCHNPTQGYTRQVDAQGILQRLSDGYTGSRYFRNAPSLINAHKKEQHESPRWGWDGRIAGSLAEAIDSHMESPRIMNMDPLLLRERMKQDPHYVAMCRKYHQDECRHEYTVDALAEFLKTLNTSSSPLDRGDLSPAAKRGRALFEGRARCGRCHEGVLFTDLRLHKTGVPENTEVFADPLRHLSYRSLLAEAGVKGAAEMRLDIGYALVSGREGDVGRFLTPTLRDLRYTAPYMHNGMFETLMEVIEFYDQGTRELPALGLAQHEKYALLAFLRSLSSATPPPALEVEISPNYEPMDNWLKRPN